MAARGRGLFSHISIQKTLMIFLSETSGPISIKHCRNVSFVTLYQDCSSRHDSSKNMETWGRGIFSQYIFIENFKNLLVRNHWTDFIITWQKCLLVDPLQRLFKLSWFAVRSWGLFSLYIYIENLKSLLVRNHWTDCNIILQKCCFGDSVPRLFKPVGFFKNMAARGRGLFSLYITIQKTLMIFLSETTTPILIKHCRNVSFVTLYQDCSSRHDSSKNKAAWGRGIYSLYIFIENFKNLLVRNHWTDFIIT